jgi:hypothetical protein
MKQKDVVFILASAFFVIIVWIIFDIYHSSISSTISEKLNIQIIPITAGFDLKTIDSIKKRDKVEPLYTTEQTPSLTPSPSVSPNVTTTPTPTITTNNQASSGGTLSQ